MFFFTINRTLFKDINKFIFLLRLDIDMSGVVLFAEYKTVILKSTVICVEVSIVFEANSFIC